jgi:hypothetical protein
MTEYGQAILAFSIKNVLLVIDQQRHPATDQRTPIRTVLPVEYSGPLHYTWKDHSLRLSE